MKVFRNLVILSILLAFVLSGVVLAKPVNKMDAEKMVKGWLKTDPKPLSAKLGGQVAETEVYNGEDGTPAYYIVYLNPSGFVIVAADDLVEPVIGFVSGDAFYDPSLENPLGALVSQDVPGRVAAAKKLQKELKAGEEVTGKAIEAQNKWNKLKKGEDLIAPMGLGSISDVRVAPLVQTKWGQDYVCNGTLTCYNYYTPSNYYCGCTATAMAQILRYMQYPTAGIGVHQFGSYSTRGGDGSGGPYNYSLMIYQPDCSVTEAQRQQIGALCYDSGVAAYMDYGSGGSSAYIHDARAAFVNTFMYSNAIMGGNESTNIGAGLNGMMNPTLDAGIPCLLGIAGGGAHAIVGDGYGYNVSTLYHHCNMGWDGLDDAWYNLPNIDASYSYNNVFACIYNLYTSGSGEIISGRVTNASGAPVMGVTMTATGPGGPYYTTTNDKGIYAFKKVSSSSTYTISPSALGCSFTPTSQNAVTGTSTTNAITSGNVWGVNFTATCTSPDILEWIGPNGTPSPWETAANWYVLGSGAHHVPTNTEVARVYNALGGYGFTDSDVTVSSTTAICLKLQMRYLMTKLTILTGGKLTTTGSVEMYQGTSAQIDIQSGATMDACTRANTALATFRVASDNSTTAPASVNLWGTLNIVSQNPANGTSSLEICNVSGGTGTGTINIYSTGVLNTDAYTIGSYGTGRIYISEGGTMKVAGNVTTQVNTDISAGTIAGASGASLSVNYNAGENKTYITASGGEPPPPPIVADYEGYDCNSCTSQDISTCTVEGLTRGGEGGTVVHVTNLNDSGAGSLRAALDGASGTGTMIVFDVGGTINLSSYGLTVYNPFVTVAGETAPAPGITINGAATGSATVTVNTHDVILRHLRVRNNAGGREIIQTVGDFNIIYDHLSVANGSDGAVDINNGTRNIVMGWCIIANTVEAHRSYGDYASLHHNFYYGNNRRQPKIVNYIGPYDFRNNVLENWTGTGTNVEAGHKVNIVNNYYGPNTAGKEPGMEFNIDPGLSDDVYIAGNRVPDGHPDINLLGDRSTPNQEPNVVTYPANTALQTLVKGRVGCMPRDAYDTAIAGQSALLVIADAGQDKTAVIGENLTFDASASTGDITWWDWNFGDGSAHGTTEVVTHSYSAANTYTVTLTVGDGLSTDVDTAIVTVVDPDAIIANAGPDQHLVGSGQTVYFDGSGSSGPITSYEWDFGDDTNGVGETTSHFYESAGEYTVTLTVTDGNQIDTDICIVTIDPDIAVTYTAGDASGWNLNDGTVLYQTIYGTAQDASGNITANSYRYISIDKGMAFVFGVDSETALDSVTFKMRGVKPSQTMRIRMFDVSGQSYLNYGHTMSKSSPGGTGTEIFDIASMTPSTIPTHDEAGVAVTDMTIDLDSFVAAPGEYLICFDAQGPDNTWGNFIRGLTDEADGMGKWPDGTNLPARATVTTSSATGNSYYYQLDSTTATDYTAYSYQYAFQMRKVVNCDSVPAQASIPNPADGANNVNASGSVTLRWQAGLCADSHDVYFGTSYNGVLNANHGSPEYKGNQTSASYNAGTLSYNTTYYWSIDEINEYGITAGPVWSFTTGPEPPAAASAPSPANSATSVSVTADLSWTAGARADSHDVYFGTGTSPAFQANQTGTTFDPGTMVGSTTYYWRIDERNAGGVTQGPTWSFTTEVTLPGQATSPGPANGATYVATNADLSWTAGERTTSHDVYFGTSSPGTFQGNQAGTTFDPGTLAYETTYYWRIDEKNAAGTTTGQVWSFTTVPDVPVADYYVDVVHGNDLNAGTTIGAPFKTIGKAVTVVAAGNTVLVMPGTYPEYVNMTTAAGTAGNPITFKGYTDGGAVIIDAAGKTHGIRCTQAYIIWDGFGIKNSNGNGILLTGTTANNCEARNCVIYGCNAEGIRLYGPDNVKIADCLIYNNDLDGIGNVNSSDGTTIDRCTIYGNSNDGINFATSDATIRDCIIVGNTLWGIDTASGCAIDIDYSDVWNNTSGSYDDLGRITVGGHCISSDPLFVNPASSDFHLQSGSPCKNTAYDGGDMGYRYGAPPPPPQPPGQAIDPSPAGGATNVLVDADLSWTAGDRATSHDVYFGTSSPGVFQGNQAGTTFDPGVLAYETTYYWRIDEKNEVGTTTGQVWSFTTANATPTFVAAGTVASSAGAITPALPSGVATGDILLLALETANQAISITNQNGGTWTEVTNSPQGTGTAGGAGATRLTVFWSRYNGTQGAPTTSDSGNHQLGRITAFRGAAASGNPWDVTAGGIDASSSTSGSIPGATTTVGTTFIVTIIATDLPDASGTANFSLWANSNLTNVTERTDNTVAAGNGGGLAIATGEKSAAGAYGNTTVTLANAAVKGMMSIALKP